jgi:hypothetical protein
MMLCQTAMCVVVHAHQGQVHCANGTRVEGHSRVELDLLP